MSNIFSGTELSATSAVILNMNDVYEIRVNGDEASLGEEQPEWMTVKFFNKAGEEVFGLESGIPIDLTLKRKEDD